MNTIEAIANVRKDHVSYTYEYMGDIYTIETPKTPLNQGVVTGEKVHVMLAVMPIPGGKPDGNKQ